MIQATVKVGFTVVRVAAQMFYHATWLVQATVHGDDFTAARETQSLDVLDGALEQFFVLKKMPRIGPEFGRTSDGPTAGKAWAGRCGSHTYECRTRLEECLTRDRENKRC